VSGSGDAPSGGEGNTGNKVRPISGTHPLNANSNVVFSEKFPSANEVGRDMLSAFVAALAALIAEGS
jgi:hypothetical protein